MEESLPAVGREWHRDLSGTEKWIIKERGGVWYFLGAMVSAVWRKGETRKGLDWRGGVDGGNGEEWAG